MSTPVPFQRTIGLFMAVMIGIGAMMGPGIFALPAPLAERVGPLGVLSYLALGLMVLPTALNYAELGAAVPVAGGGYTFVSRTLPRTIAFLTGWFFWIGNVLAAAMYVLIFALTVQDIWPLLAPEGLPAPSIPLVALLVTAVFWALNLRGTQKSLAVIALMNIIELGVLLGFAALGMFMIQPEVNLSPVAPKGLMGFVPSMALIYVSFVGFDLITVAAEEIKDPGKTIPRAILITLVSGVAIYVLVVGVMLGAVHWSEIASSDVPFIYAADKLFGPWGRWAGVVATIMACLSAFSVTLGASARILFALSRDGHLPKPLSRLHQRFQTPHLALMVCAVVVVAFSSSGIVALVASVSAFGYLTGQGLVNFSVIALEKKMPALRRPFRMPGFPWLPLIGVFTCWMFIPTLEWEAFTLGGLLTMVGGGVYLAKEENRAQLAQVPGAIRVLLVWLINRRRMKMRVLIISGGRLGQNIAERLLARDETRLGFRAHEHQITFIEPDEARCVALEKRFGVPIFQGDGTKREILQQVGLNNIDVAIAASDDDGQNVITALQAKRLGMKRVMAIVQDSEYIPLLEGHDVTAISAPWTTAGLVENHLDRPGVAELFEIETGTAHLLGVIVPDDSRVAGKRIRELDIPTDSVVAAIIRNHEFVVPRGDTIIQPQDHVVFVGPALAVQEARDTFLG